MAVALTSASNGQVGINGVPIQRGTIDLNHIDFKNEKLTAHVRGQHNPVIKEAAYTEITIDGVAAANWNAVKTFVQENFFFDVNGGGGGTGNGFIKSILIESTSNTVTDADFADKTITLMFITVRGENGGAWLSSGFTQTADTIDNTNNGGFDSGSLVFFFGE